MAHTWNRLSSWLGAAGISMALVLGVSFAPALHAGEESPEAPAATDFTLTDTDGDSHTLFALDGIVVLEWTNKDCPYVKAHYDSGRMQELAKKYMAKGVTWLAIDSTHFHTSDEVAAWRKDKGIGHPVLLDAGGEVGTAYSARTTPHMKVIVDRKVVYDGAIDNREKGDAYACYVAEVLDKAIAGEAVAYRQTRPYGCSVKYKRDK
jgi:peroxiredoxin